MNSAPKRNARRVVTGVEISTQIPLLEKVGPHWLLWIEYDITHNIGVCLRLLGDGQIWRETVTHETREVKVVKNKS